MPSCEKIPLAEVVISDLGGVRKTAKELNIEPTSVSKWRAEKEKKGSAGDVPHSVKPKLLALYEAGKISATPAEIIRGYRKA